MIDVEPTQTAHPRQPRRDPRRRRRPRRSPTRDDERIALPDVAGHDHPAAGRPPGDGGTTTTATTRSTAAASPVVRRRRSAGAAQARPTHRTVSAASETGSAPQSTAAPGSRAPCSATRTIQATHHEASVPRTVPSGAQISPTRAPARPSTVAGPTTGATTRLAATATRLTWPEMAATSGVHATCAASGTTTASATQRGAHRRQRVAPTGCQQQDSRGGQHREREADARGQPGVEQQEDDDRDAQSPGAAPTPTGAEPHEGHGPHRCGPQDARLGPGQQQEPAMPTAATATRPRPRTPTQRVRTSRKPTRSVRLVPETAVRWVRPVVCTSSTRRGSMAASSPTTSAGTRARWSAGRPWTDARREARTRSAARHHRSGAVRTSGVPRTVRTPARAGSSDGASRPDACTLAPRRTSRHDAAPTTRTGARTSKAAPRPVTWSTRARKRTCVP